MRRPSGKPTAQSGGREGTSSFIEKVKRANAPPPPEHSVAFRLITTVAVVTGIVACGAVGELSAITAGVATVAVASGMTFSYASRNKPVQWLKVVLAVAVIFVFVWFVDQIMHAAGTGQLSSIEIPLAGLFTWVQVVHSFDVPARRDLLFSLAAAAALVTVASAQAVSEGFLVFVAVLLVTAVLGLACSWRSMTGGAAISAPVLAACLGCVVVVALGLVTVLPAPRANQSLTLPASLSSFLPLSGNGLVNGTGSNPSEPARPGKPGGTIGVGGYVGFSGPLDIANRDSLGDQVIMRVRADRPGYFLGLTYDTWNGQSWLQSRHEEGGTRISGGSPFEIPQPQLAGRHVTDNVQTVYVEQPLPNILFATSDPEEVYFPTSSLILGRDGSIRSTVAVTPGTVYTVVSADDEASPKALSAETTPLDAHVRSFPEIRDALQLPYAYPRVAALARRIVARARAKTTMAKVAALEHWIGHNTEYTTDIPPLRPGEDAVNEFLFGNKKGYCEQISTALAVMLRTLGVPAREAIGYVPGSFDPLSDTYDIEAKDAHAWVQVYFPGYGWQSFDPTAQVPLAPENPGTVLARDVFSATARLPLIPIGGLAGTGAAGYGALVWRRRRARRPKSWEGRAAARLERLGRRAGVARSSTETLADYARRLDEVAPRLGLLVAAAELEASAYSRSSGEPCGERRREGVDVALDGLKHHLRRKRLHALGSGFGRSPRGGINEES